MKATLQSSLLCGLSHSFEGLERKGSKWHQSQNELKQNISRFGISNTLRGTNRLKVLFLTVWSVSTFNL